MLGMTAALLATAAFLILSSIGSLPVSTTHAVVGAVVGMTALSTAPMCVKWGALGRIAASWVVSPLLAGALGSGLYKLLQRFVILSPCALTSCTGPPRLNAAPDSPCVACRSQPHHSAVSCVHADECAAHTLAACLSQASASAHCWLHTAHSLHASQQHQYCHSTAIAALLCRSRAQGAACQPLALCQLHLRSGEPHLAEGAADAGPGLVLGPAGCSGVVPGGHGRSILFLRACPVASHAVVQHRSAVCTSS